MILLTKMDNTTMLLNLDSVKYLESVPDTLIFFVNGDSLMVKESLDEVRQKIADYHASLVNRPSKP